MNPLPPWYVNASAAEWQAPALAEAPLAFHRAMPGYAPTRLVELPSLAAELGIGRLFVKEEAERFGLPAFKMLGASYAVTRALARRWDAIGQLRIDDLRDLAARHEPVELVAATDGNHGRAVAHMARLIGLPARIFHPAGISPEAKAALAEEGATAVEVEGYDAAVRAALAHAHETSALLVQDSAQPGAEEIVEWIVDGYGTILEEVAEQLAALGVARADLIVVPVGVGTLAESVVRWAKSDGRTTAVLGVEPATAPSVIAALHAGEPVELEETPSIMAGLNCGFVAINAWPSLVAGLDLAVIVDDAQAATAVHDLEGLGVDAGPCGAASLAGIRAALSDDMRRALSGIGPDAVVVLLSTESRAANPLPTGM